jgi:hypothetical protein
MVPVYRQVQRILGAVPVGGCTCVVTYDRSVSMQHRLALVWRCSSVRMCRSVWHVYVGTVCVGRCDCGMYRAFILDIMGCMVLYLTGTSLLSYVYYIKME